MTSLKEASPRTCANSWHPTAASANKKSKESAAVVYCSSGYLTCSLAAARSLISSIIFRTWKTFSLLELALLLQSTIYSDFPCLLLAFHVFIVLQDLSLIVALNVLADICSSTLFIIALLLGMWFIFLITVNF